MVVGRYNYPGKGPTLARTATMNIIAAYIITLYITYHSQHAETHSSQPGGPYGAGGLDPCGRLPNPALS